MSLKLNKRMPESSVPPAVRFKERCCGKQSKGIWDISEAQRCLLHTTEENQGHLFRGDYLARNFLSEKNWIGLNGE